MKEGDDILAIDAESIWNAILKWWYIVSIIIIFIHKNNIRNNIINADWFMMIYWTITTFWSMFLARFAFQIHSNERYGKHNQEKYNRLQTFSIYIGIKLRQN